MARGVSPEKSERNCIQCGTIYHAKMWDQKFCSPKCKNKNHYWREREKRNNWWRRWQKQKLTEDPNYYKKAWQKRKDSKARLAYKPIQNEKARLAYKKLRIEVLDKYGGCCTCCGERTLEFLSIDHIDGGGSKHRKSLKGRTIWKWLKENNYPSGFQVLCFNCNCAKGFYGQCPHNRIRKDST